jgi:hypothetical protein
VTYNRARCRLYGPNQHLRRLVTADPRAGTITKGPLLGQLVEFARLCDFRFVALCGRSSQSVNVSCWREAALPETETQPYTQLFSFDVAVKGRS